MQTSSTPSVLEASLATAMNPVMYLQTLSSSFILSVIPISAGVSLHSSLVDVVMYLFTVDTSIVLFFNTHQVISLKLTNTNYFY